MYKIVLITFLCFAHNSFCQNYSAYQNVKPIQTDFGSFARQGASINARQQQIKAQRRANNFSSFDYYRNLSIKSFYAKKYTECINYYNSTKKLGWHDSNLEYSAGASYYELWSTTGIKKYKSMAKKILKKAKKRGSISADLFLRKI